MNKKVLITILVILGLAIIVGGFWYYLQSRNNTNLTRNDGEGKQEQNQKMDNNKENENQNQEEQKGENNKELDFEKIDTSNWKEYCNKEYGFCVKYPEGWDIQESYINNSKEFDFIDSNNNFIIFSVTYYKNWASLGWQPREKNNLKKYIEASKVANIKALSLDNENAYSAIFKNSVINYEELFVIAEHNKHIYKLSFRNTTEMKEIQKEILKTFKFIN